MHSSFLKICTAALAVRLHTHSCLQFTLPAVSIRAGRFRLCNWSLCSRPCRTGWVSHKSVFSWQTETKIFLCQVALLHVTLRRHQSAADFREPAVEGTVVTLKLMLMRVDEMVLLYPCSAVLMALLHHFWCCMIKKAWGFVQWSAFRPAKRLCKTLMLGVFLPGVQLDFQTLYSNIFTFTLKVSNDGKGILSISTYTFKVIIGGKGKIETTICFPTSDPNKLGIIIRSCLHVGGDFLTEWRFSERGNWCMSGDAVQVESLKPHLPVIFAHAFWFWWLLPIFKVTGEFVKNSKQYFLVLNESLSICLLYSCLLAPNLLRKQPMWQLCMANLKHTYFTHVFYTLWLLLELSISEKKNRYAYTIIFVLCYTGCFMLFFL